MLLRYPTQLEKIGLTDLVFSPVQFPLERPEEDYVSVCF